MTGSASPPAPQRLYHTQVLRRRIVFLSALLVTVVVAQRCALSTRCGRSPSFSRAFLGTSGPTRVPFSDAVMVYSTHGSSITPLEFVEPATRNFHIPQRVVFDHRGRHARTVLNSRAALVSGVAYWDDERLAFVVERFCAAEPFNVDDATWSLLGAPYLDPKR